MRIFKFLFLSVLFVGLYSCSSSDDNGSAGSASISITPSTSTQIIGEPITFTVKTDADEDVTATSNITSGSTILQNATLNSYTVGNFVVKATYGGKSASVTVTFTDAPPTSIILLANSTNLSQGDKTTFTVKTNTGINITQSAVIKVDGNPITGGEFTSNVPGSFNAIATFENFTSETVTIVYNPAINFRKRVLIEDYTGTWCGYCPRVAQGIDLVMAQTEYAVPVAIHRGQDPYNFAGASVLESLIGLQGYPDARLNRLTAWAYPEPSNVSQVISYTEGTAPKLGLAMTANVSGGNVSLTVKTKFGKTMTGVKLVVYALENGLIYNQTNYTSYYGGGSTIVGFTHNHVLKATYTNILGDEIPSSESVYDNTYTKTYSFPVPTNVSNSANMEFVAFVVGADKKAINVRKAVSGDDQSFEIIE
ncbi:Omp28-related outer membrane protein [Flavobacterium sp. SM2513]|uniref:Omp28-related outer membrane protein n=1 Tax=Flavobacterium sp. SM2513 TaxID=3424766 RepID=UPI003D7F2975